MGIFNSFKKKSEKQEVDNTIEQTTQEQVNIEATEKEPEAKPEKQDNDFLCYIKEMYPATEGGTKVIAQVLIGKINEKEQVLYVNQEGRVLGGCTIASIDQANNRLEEATEKGTHTYGTYYGLYLPEINREEVVKGNLLVSTSMLEGDRIEKLNVEELLKEKEKELHESSPNKVSFARKNEIGPRILFTELKKEDLQDLTIQESIYLLNSLNIYNSKHPMSDFLERDRICREAIIEKIQEADKLYVTVDKNTNCPFINEGFVDVYSAEEFAKDAVDYYAQRYRMLEVKELKKGMMNDRVNFFVYLYIIGAEKLNIDNGQYRVVLDRSEIVEVPDYSKMEGASAPIFNPKLRFAMIDFFGELRWKVNYAQRPEVIKAKENAMIEEICKAKYLVPMKTQGNAERVGDKIRFTDDGQMVFAKITNTEDEEYIPVFSDWMEFEKLYDKDEWNGAVLTILDAISIGNGSGVAINPYGENLILNENNMREIKEECQRLNIACSFDA
ncbi:MAG: SseB family protein [Clostridiales bacterium]|nr:SseB family protein [Clostridiales bacterium]